jgi:hypothetical protein
MHENINKSMFEKGAVIVTTVLDETHEELKGASKQELLKHESEIAQQVAGATQTVFRYVGGFNKTYLN